MASIPATPHNWTSNPSAFIKTLLAAEDRGPGERGDGVGDHSASPQGSPSQASVTSQHQSPNDIRPRKPKQKRNKPTLSCRDCVEHKTKCDRVRPSCLACVKRSSPCRYSHIADVLAASATNGGRPRRPSKAKDDRGPSKCSIANITHPSSVDNSPELRQPQTHTLSQSRSQHRVESAPASADGYGRPESLPSLDHAPMSVFGMGGQHPFANYWTCKGGLAEVVGVLPSKVQADLLIAKYFEIVDPLYPILDRPAFLAEYEHFWSLPHEEKCKFEAATLSLHFVLYACATQYIELPSPSERTKTAEFYISAGHQALRISSYLNRMTITTVQAMVLIFYFLVNDNHVSDAWTFSGITQRQAYVLQLNREPQTVAPQATIAEKNLRCKLWSVIIYQETGIALTLNFPAQSALQSDIGPHSLNYDEADKTANFNTRIGQGGSPISSLCSDLTKTDISYCKSIWAYASFVNENMCRQRALGLPLCHTNEHKRDMLSSFRSLYRSLPQPFGSYDPKRFLDPRRRVARQQIALTQSFFHSMMLICADEHVQADVMTDMFGTLEAAHEAMSAFFAMNSLFGDEMCGWWTCQHYAFEEAMLVANLLAADTKPLFPPALDSGRARECTLLVTAKEDVKRMLDVMSRNPGLFQDQAGQERCSDTLQAVFDAITVV